MDERLSLAECYTLGLDPADVTDDFRIVSIELVDEEPKVEWEPKVNRWMGVELKAVLKGAERLEGPWEDVPEGSGSPGGLAPPKTARPEDSPHHAVLQGGGGGAVGACRDSKRTTTR